MRRPILTTVVAIWVGLRLATPTVQAQGTGPIGSLGGYGAASPYASAGMDSGGPMVIPYGGTFEGFMPGRMGGGSSLSFRPRPAEPMTSARSSFRLSPMSGRMSSMSGDAGRSRAGMGSISPPNIRSARGVPRGMSGATGMGVMPPRIGYPFRQPPSPVGPPSPTMGMSM